MLNKARFKRLKSGLLAGIMFLTMILPGIPVTAEDTDSFPYTMFAASSEAGAITVDAGNFSVNGNIATNGTIATKGNVNINGVREENVNEKMINIFEKLNNTYFSGSDVTVHTEDYSSSDTNININNPMNIEGKLELTGNINLNTQVKAEEDIVLKGEVINTSNSIITSKTGDIVIESVNVNFNGLIYAPEGNVIINAQNVNMNNIIVIAQCISIDASNVNANYNASMGEFIGGQQDEDFDPDLPLSLYAYGEYLADGNSIDITWNTTYPKGTFDIQISEDNDTYTTIDTVTDTNTYNYSITESFDTIYFKITQTNHYDETASSIPFLVVKTDSGYELELLDTDGDGLADIIEEICGTDINNPDTDGDGLTDYQEVYLTGTDPLVYNSFDEDLSDADADSDGDGISNIDEILLGTDPLSADTDGDGLSDWDEINIYNTDPLNPDTDGDGLLDGDEIKIGLDPTDPETFGIPDAEYEIEQSISADSEAFFRINTEDSPYKISMDITAAGYVEGNISVRETPYSKTISNDSIIGIAPQLDYEFKDSIESVTLKFELTEDIIEDSIDLFPEVEELSGIKRFNIFKYFEDINMLLPIETQFDIENNLIYTEVDELGTYCVMDMELWLDSFDVPEEIYNEPESFTKMLIAEEKSTEFSEDESRIVISDITKTDENDNTEDINETINAEMTINNQLMEAPSTPIDLVFIIQTAGVFETTFNEQREMIRNVSYNLFDMYSDGDVRICVIEYKENEAYFAGNYLTWHGNLATLSFTLDNISYDSTYEYCNRGTAFQKMLEEVTFRDSAGKFVYKIMNGLSYVGVGYFDQLDACAERDIIYSEIMPSELEYEDPEYQQMVEDAIAQTNGINLTFDDSTEQEVYEHIVSIIAPPQMEFSAIVPTGWKDIVLDGVLDPYNRVDTDGDNLTDWQEVDTEKLDWAADGTILLPTISNCLEFSDKPYAEDGLQRFKEGQQVPGMPTSNFIKYIDYILYNTKILPIISDPTDVDTDGDLDSDNIDPKPLKYQLNGNFINKIKSLEELAYDYNNGAWDVLMKYSVDKEYWFSFMFIRQFQDRYDSGIWSSVGGEIDYGFLEYVYDNDKDLYDYFKETESIYANEKGDTADLRHLAATATVYIYRTDLLDARYYNYESYGKWYNVFSNIKTLLNNAKTIAQSEMFEYHLDNLGGWAGDLQTLMNDTMSITSKTEDYNEFYDTLYGIIGSSEHSFSMDDLYADTDAYNVYMLLYNDKADSLNGAFEDYYLDGYKYRFSSFTNYWDKSKISDLVYTYTINKFAKVQKWPLFEERYDYTETQSKAARDAFVDFLMKKISEECV